MTVSKKGLVIAWLTLLLTGIAGFFWRSEWIYALPTPVPANYHPVVAGTRINWSGRSVYTLPSGKPLFLHFFNPDCPCSRFNIPQFQSLLRRYARQTDFALVLMTAKHYTPDAIRRRFDLPSGLPILSDSSVAAACGVYSTPQAVILDADDHLYYRGNYNRSRYCTDEKSSYARLALESLLHNDLHPVFDPLALKAYGCKLPTCTQ